MLTEHALPAVGTWSLRRRLEDRTSGRSGVVRGLLDVSAGTGGEGLRWSERGVLRWDGRDLPVTRDYLLHPEADGAWWMRFADGRPFHLWRVGEDVEHPCAADLYRGRYDAGPGWMAVRWQVAGPHKDQVVTTELHLLGRRRGGPAGGGARRPGTGGC